MIRKILLVEDDCELAAITADMYTTVIDDTDFAIKPMNCPGGMGI